MIRKIISLFILVSMPAFSETGQQRLRRIQAQENPSILERIEGSGLKKHLKVLDNYFQQVDEKLHSQEGIEKKPPDTNKSAVKTSASKDVRQVLPVVKTNDKDNQLEPSSNVEHLFSQAINNHSQVVDRITQTNLKIRNRDPFAITEEMVRNDASLQASLSFLPHDKPKFTVPTMILKGLVMGGDGNYVAVLDIEGYGTKMVREGDTIGLQGSGDEAAIRIKKITRLQIIVEAGKVGKVIVVR